MPRAGLTPQRVVQEAGAVADATGLDRLTLAAVADRFGVAIPSLYKHVNGLDGLRRDLAVLATRELTAVLSRAAVGRAGRDTGTGSQGMQRRRAAAMWNGERDGR